MLRFRAADQPDVSSIFEALTAHHKQLANMGGELPGEFRKPRRTGRRGDRANRGPRTRCRAALRTGDPSAHGNGFVHNEASPTNSPRASTRRAVSRRSRTRTCGKPDTATSVGEPMARCGNSTSYIRSSGKKSQCRVRRARSGHRSNTWIWLPLSKSRKQCRARSSWRN